MGNLKWLKIAGALTAASSLVFIGLKVWENFSLIETDSVNMSTWLLVLAAAFIYGSSQFSLSTAWGLTLRTFGAKHIKFEECHRIYGRTQIGKYLPGNFIHFASRHLYAAKEGLRHKLLLFTSLFEIISVIFTASCIGLIGGLLNNTEPNAFSTKILTLVVVTSFFISLFVYFYAHRATNEQYLEPPHLIQITKTYLVLICLYFIFFTFSGAVMTLATYTQTQQISLNAWGFFIFAFSVSWLIGFITPGAPGGIGVREAILISLLSRSISEPESILITLLLRLITTLGDLIFFAESSLLTKPQMKANSTK